jgi:hypothetical protein
MWPDEPGWDCMWLTDGYKMGLPNFDGTKVTIPVEFNRLGLVCDVGYFEGNDSLVTLQYELIRSSGSWKIAGPIPDYPEIDAEVCIKELKEFSSRPNESAHRRAQADSLARTLSVAVGQARRLR